MSDNNMNGNFGEMNHATITLPKPNVHAAHPFVSKQNHEKLLAYLKQRLVRGKAGRDAQIERFVNIDKSISGWMRLSDQDKERQNKKETTGIPQAVSMNLPLGYVHLDDMMTYFAATFSPNRGMFYQTGKPEDMDQGGQIVTLMNNHAIYAGYFREVLLGIFCLLKYNTGGFHVYWAKEDGPKIVKTEDGETNVASQLRWQGNKLEAIDVYNFMPDPQVHPTKLHSDGEFTATAKMRSHYWLQNKAAQGTYFNCEKALKNSTGSSQTTYYRNPPAEAQMEQNDSSGTNWVNILSGGNGYGGEGNGFELTEIYIKLNPTEFGLVQGSAAQKAARSRYETWRFTILNDETIIDATYMNNIHGFLPAFCGVLNDDLMGTSQKSTLEILQPLQDFASFLLNTHVASTRKRLYGVTVYDPTMVDLKQIPEGEVAARVPMNPAAYGRDVRTGVWKDETGDSTNQTMEDLDSVMGVINQFFPTQSLPSQIASIDRAVTNQVAAVQQGANRRQQKAARLLDDSLFRNVRFSMYYNIMQYQPDESEVTDLYTGKKVTVDIAKLRQTDLPFIIGQGLKAIDRQAAAESLQQIIFALIQAPAAAQGVDLLSLIGYWTSMIDIDIDMSKFKLAPPPAAAVGPDGLPIPDAVAAEGNAIQPATAPAAITAPIYGG